MEDIWRGHISPQHLAVETSSAGWAEMMNGIRNSRETKYM